MHVKDEAAAELMEEEVDKHIKSAAVELPFNKPVKCNESDAARVDEEAGDIDEDSGCMDAAPLTNAGSPSDELVLNVDDEDAVDKDVATTASSQQDKVGEVSVTPVASMLHPHEDVEGPPGERGEEAQRPILMRWIVKAPK